MFLRVRILLWASQNFANPFTTSGTATGTSDISGKEQSCDSCTWNISLWWGWISAATSLNHWIAPSGPRNISGLALIMSDAEINLYKCWTLNMKEMIQQKCYSNLTILCWRRQPDAKDLYSLSLRMKFSSSFQGIAGILLFLQLVAHQISQDREQSCPWNIS